MLASMTCLIRGICSTLCLALCLQERERNKGQKKSLTLQQQSEEGDFTGPSSMEGVGEGEMIKVRRTVK